MALKSMDELEKGPRSLNRSSPDKIKAKDVQIWLQIEAWYWPKAKTRTDLNNSNKLLEVASKKWNIGPEI